MLPLLKFFYSLSRFWFGVVSTRFITKFTLKDLAYKKIFEVVST